MEIIAPTPHPELTPANPLKPEMELCVRPASEWFREVELLIKSLSAERQELRRKMSMEKEQLQKLQPNGEERFSARDAREMAKSTLLGADWQRANERIHQARQRVISARRQLQGLASEARSTRERSNKWAYWLLHAPRYALSARPLKKRLRHANAHRREALKTVQALRPLLVLPEIRGRIFRLTEDLRLKAERLTESVQSREEIDQKLTETLAPALRLSPRLRDLGTELVSMKRATDPALRLTMAPIPVEPLCTSKSVPHEGQSIRVH